MRLILAILLVFSTSVAWPSAWEKTKNKLKKATSKSLEVIERKAKKYHVNRGAILSLRIRTEESYGNLDPLPPQERVFLASFDQYLQWISEIPKRGIVKEKFEHLIHSIPFFTTFSLIKDVREFLIEEILLTRGLGSSDNLNVIEKFLQLVHEMSLSKEKKAALFEVVFLNFDLISPYRIVLASHFDHELLMSPPAQRYFDTWAQRTISYMNDDSGKHFIQIGYYDWLGYESPEQHIWSDNAYLPQYLVEPIVRKMRKVRDEHPDLPLMWDANSHGVYIHQGKKYWYSGEVGYPKAHDDYKGYLYPLAKKLKEEKLVARVIHRGALPEEF